jgi:23S rRNA pseudouridine1911/1915/1917 synthase
MTQPPTPPCDLPPLEGEHTAQEAGRLDACLRDLLQRSHKATRKLISTGKVSVNGERVDRWEHKVKAGDTLSVVMSAPNPKRKEALGAQLVYQDDAIAVLNKPAGLLSAPSLDEDEPSALIAAHRLCRGPRRPRVVHRLDKDTSGLLMFSRTLPATRVLQGALERHEVRRLYRCVVQGEMQGEGGYISSGLVRDAGRGRRGSAPKSRRHHPLGPPPAEREVEGKWALTRYRVIERTSATTALEVELFTGRTHQIRIHLAELGHPIVGEWVYAPRPKSGPRLALHAAALRLRHPFSGEDLLFEAPWPRDLSRLRPIPRAWRGEEPTLKRMKRSEEDT